MTIDRGVLLTNNLLSNQDTKTVAVVADLQVIFRSNPHFIVKISRN